MKSAPEPPVDILLSDGSSARKRIELLLSTILKEALAQNVTLSSGEIAILSSIVKKEDMKRLHFENRELVEKAAALLEAAFAKRCAQYGGKKAFWKHCAQYPYDYGEFDTF